jgi:hypothetical protein
MLAFAKKEAGGSMERYVFIIQGMVNELERRRELEETE